MRTVYVGDERVGPVPYGTTSVTFTLVGGLRSYNSPRWGLFTGSEGANYGPNWVRYEDTLGLGLWFSYDDKYGDAISPESLLEIGPVTLQEGGKVITPMGTKGTLRFGADTSVNFRPRAGSPEEGVVTAEDAEGGNYNSGDEATEPVTLEVDAYLGNGSGASTQSWEFWKWVRSDTGETMGTSPQLTVAPYLEDYYYEAVWRPANCRVAVNTVTLDAYSVGVEPAENNGLYFARATEGDDPVMLAVLTRIDPTLPDALKLTVSKTLTVYDPMTAQSTTETSSEVVDVTLVDDVAEIPIYGESREDAVDATYSIRVGDPRDRLAVSLTNTYLLKGAGYAALGGGIIAVTGGEYSVTFNQPEDASYTVAARVTGELTALAGTVVDTMTGKLWRATFALYAVPKDPATEDPENPWDEDPEDPEDPKLPGGGGGGGGDPGLPLLTNPVLSLVIQANDVSVTAGTAAVKNGETEILTVSYPSAPASSKVIEKGVSYLLTIGSIGEDVEVVAVTLNDAVLGYTAGNAIAIPATDEATVRTIVVTLGIKTLPRLVIEVLSYPEQEIGETPNGVSRAPAPSTSYGGYRPGTEVVMTGVPATGYDLYAWRVANVLGFDETVATAAPYNVRVNSDTAVIAYFQKTQLGVTLQVQGWPACTQFAWCNEAADAGDTVPVSFGDATTFKGAQIGIFKTGASKLQTADDTTWGQTWVDMSIAGVDLSIDGGTTWIDAGGAYPAAYNLQSSPRAAARVGKVTVPAGSTGTVIIRVRLLATVSISVGIPAVLGYTSMGDSGQKNWGGGFGTAIITNAAGVSNRMVYETPLDTATPLPYYPYINAELGANVTALAIPYTGFLFRAFHHGYFSHSWEDTGVDITSQDRVRWPASLLLSTDASAVLTVDRGAFKIMALFAAVVAERYIMFTRQLGTVMALRPGQTATELIQPSLMFEMSGTNATWGYRQPLFDPDSGRNSGSGITKSAVLTAFGVSDSTLTGLGVEYYGAWRGNIGGLASLLKQVWADLFLYWGPGWSTYFGDNAAYLGLYRRVHEVTAGAHSVGPWEFVGTGTRTSYASTPTTYHSYDCKNQRFFDNIEYCVRFVPYEMTPPPAARRVTIGYKSNDDMIEGEVFWKVGAAAEAGPLNVLNIQADIPSGSALVLRAVPEEGKIFVGWHDAAGVRVSESATYTPDLNTSGLVFLAVFQPDLVIPDPQTVFRVGYVAGMYEYGRVRVFARSSGGEVLFDEDAPDGGKAYTVPSTAFVSVVGRPITGYVTSGWANADGVVVYRDRNYFPLISGRLYGDVVFGVVEGPPPPPGEKTLTAGFGSLTQAANGLLSVTVAGVQHPMLTGALTTTVPVSWGDLVRIEVAPLNGYTLTGFVDGTYTSLGATGTVLEFTAGSEYATAEAWNEAPDLIVLALLAPPPADPTGEPTPGVLSDAGVWLLEGGAGDKEYIWRSKRYEFPRPIDFAVAKVWQGTFSPSGVRLNLYCSESPNAVSTEPAVSVYIGADETRRLPTVRRTHYVELEVRGSVPVDRVAVATSVDAIGGR